MIGFNTPLREKSEAWRALCKLLPDAWLRWTIYLAFWASIGIFSAIKAYAWNPDLRIPPWWITLNLAGHWLIWGALIAPIVLRLSAKFLIKPPKVKRNVLILLSLAFLTPGVHLFVTALYSLGLRYFPEFHMDMEFFYRSMYARFMDYWGIYFAVFGTLVGFEHMFTAISQMRAHAAMSSQLVEAKLASLKSQIHPHFLFNTLHTITNLQRLGDHELAREITTKLARLLRISIDTNSRATHSIADELNHISLYLTVMETRFRGRLETKIINNLETKDRHVPVLILLPIVENSMKHGLEADTQAKRVSITIDDYESGVRIVVCNDGPKLDDSFELKCKMGLGTSNVVERLRNIYGDLASFTIENDEHGGVRNVLLISKDKRPEDIPGKGSEIE